MIEKIVLSGAVLLAAAAGIGAAQTPSAGPHVCQVIVLENPTGATPASVAKLTAALTHGREVAGSLRVPAKSRLWLESYSGSNVGRVALVVEFDSLRTFADVQAHAMDTKWDKVRDDLGSSGWRIVSSSLVTELTP